MPVARVPVRAILVAALMFSPAARTEVLSAQREGFITRSQVSIAAAPGEVYPRLLQVGRWWSDEHTYSGAARNMSLEARPGGCWCEKLEKNGFIEHGRVVYAATAKVLRLDASLGPLHETGARGSLNLQLEPEGSGTRVTLTYVGMGFEPKNGLASMAPLFDAVLSEAMQRLKRYVESGASSRGR
jgi:hypothetical protein